jgi:hypothetical protein
MLTALSEWWCERGSGDFRDLIIHVDTARLHKAAVSQQFMARNAIAITAHPPYSSDPAPSDFHLLGYVKAVLGKEFIRIRFDTGGE